MAETLHKLSLTSEAGYEYSSLATLESDLNSKVGTWAGTWTDNHVIEVMWASSSDEVSGRLFVATTNMNGQRVIIRPNTGDGYASHAGAATNPQYYDATKGACWKETTGDYCIVATSGSVTQNVTVQDMQIKATGGAIAAVRFSNEANKAELYRNIIQCDGTQVVLLNPWTTGTAVVEGNLLIGTGTGTHGLSISNDGGTQTMNIRDNTIVLTGSAGASIGIRVVGGSGSIGGVLYNNAVAGFNTDCDWTPTSGTHNATDKGAGGLPSGNRVQNLVMATEWVSATVDFRVKAGSALLNAGTNSFGPSTDRIGQAISNTTKDIGGWEYQAAVSGYKRSSNMTGGMQNLSGGLSS